jgi:hypothetical protein
MNNVVTIDKNQDARLIRNLRRRLDHHALDQLRQEVANLSLKLDEALTELRQVKKQLEFAIQDADAWRDHSDHLMDILNSDIPGKIERGLTQNGTLVVLKNVSQETEDHCQ